MIMQALTRLILFLTLASSPLLLFAADMDRADSLYKEAEQLYNQQRFQQAIERYRESLSLYTELGSQKQMAVVRHQLAFAHIGLGDRQTALSYLEDNLSYHRSRNSVTDINNYLFYCAQLYARENEATRALDYLEQIDVREISDQNKLAEIMKWAVTVHQTLGNLDTARNILVNARKFISDDGAWRQHLAPLSTPLGIRIDREVEQQHRNRMIGLYAAALALILTLILLGRNARFRPYLTNAAVVLVSVLLSLLVAELALQHFQARHTEVSHFLHPPGKVTEFHPEPGIMPGVNYKRTLFSINNVGMRGDPLPEDPSVLRLITIGGSSTETLFLDDQDAWPYVLQNALTVKLERDVWVGNAGKSGLNSFSHVVQMYYHSREIEPDAVIVAAGINDLNQCISGGKQAISDNAELIRRPEFYQDYRRYVFDIIPPRNPYVDFRLVELVRRWRSNLTGDTNRRAAEEFAHVVQDEAGRFYVEQRERRRNAKKVRRLPDIDACLDSYEANLQRIVDIAEEHHIRLYFLTQGSLYRSDLTSEELDLLWFGSVNTNPFAKTPAKRYYSAMTMQRLLQQYNNRTLGVCEQNNLDCFNADEFVPKSTESYYDDVHLNTLGSHTLARAVADFMAPRLADLPDD